VANAGRRLSGSSSKSYTVTKAVTKVKKVFSTWIGIRQHLKISNFSFQPLPTLEETKQKYAQVVEELKQVLKKRQEQQALKKSMSKQSYNTVLWDSQ
jgi:hypothetical protein